MSLLLLGNKEDAVCVHPKKREKNPNPEACFRTSLQKCKKAQPKRKGNYTTQYSPCASEKAIGIHADIIKSFLSCSCTFQ